MDISRQHDIKTVEEGMKSKDPLMRQVAKNAGEKIKREQYDGWTQDARQSLIKETLKGNKANAQQIRDDMVRRRGGRLGKGNRGESVTFGLHFTEDQWDFILNGPSLIERKEKGEL